MIRSFAPYIPGTWSEGNIKIEHRLKMARKLVTQLPAETLIKKIAKPESSELEGYAIDGYTRSWYCGSLLDI